MKYRIKEEDGIFIPQYKNKLGIVWWNYTKKPQNMDIIQFFFLEDAENFLIKRKEADYRIQERAVKCKPIYHDFK